jgi:aspartate/methionine/tyrosine aminotransferase
LLLELPKATPWIRLYGLSKTFAAGGLRVGWGVCSSPTLARELQEARLALPEPHAAVAARGLLRGWAGTSAERELVRVMTSEYKQSSVETLRSQRNALLALFEKHGLHVPEGHPAGLFLFPDVRPLLRREVTTQNERQTLSEDNLTRILLDDFGVRVNGGAWSGAAGRIRVCFSLRPERFALALERLERFFLALTPTAP